MFCLLLISNGQTHHLTSSITVTESLSNKSACPPFAIKRSGMPLIGSAVIDVCGCSICHTFALCKGADSNLFSIVVTNSRYCNCLANARTVYYVIFLMCKFYYSMACHAPPYTVHGYKVP